MTTLAVVPVDKPDQPLGTFENVYVPREGQKVIIDDECWDVVGVHTFPSLDKTVIYVSKTFAEYRFLKMI